MIQIPRKFLAKLWIRVKKIGWDKEEFYAWLRENYNRERLHDLTQRQLNELMDILHQEDPDKLRLSGWQRDEIYRLAGDLVLCGENLEAYVRKVVRNNAGVDSVDWLTPRLAHKVIGTLKAARRRKYGRCLYA